MFWELSMNESTFNGSYDFMEWVLKRWEKRPSREQVMDELALWGYALKNEESLFSKGISGVFTDNERRREISLNFYATWDENPFND